MLWDFLPFHIPQVPGPRLSPAGSSEAFWDTGRSLQRLHLDPSLSSHPFPPCHLPNSSVGSWRPFPTAFPECHPEGFELPGAQGSGQRPEGPACGLAAKAIWGFSHVEPEARTSVGNPPARVPWRYPPKGTVYPLLWGRRFLFSLHWFDFHAEDRLTPWWHVE